MPEFKLLCPVCRSELEITHTGRYQDMCEHVSNPNSEPSLKDGYQCTNVDWCEAALMNFTWIADGDVFLSDPPPGVTRSGAFDKLEKLSTSGMTYAINSWNHFYHRGKAEIAKRSRKIHIGKYTLKIEPKELGYKYPTDKQYMPSTFSWRYEIWKKNENHTSTHIIPIHEMVLYTVGSFKRTYGLIQRGSEHKSNVRECMEYMTGRRYGQDDDRLYVRISAFLIKFLYPLKCRKIRRLTKELNITW